jgi:hypothetical protein
MKTRCRDTPARSTTWCSAWTNDLAPAAPAGPLATAANACRCAGRAPCHPSCSGEDIEAISVEAFLQPPQVQVWNSIAPNIVSHPGSLAVPHPCCPRRPGWARRDRGRSACVVVSRCNSTQVANALHASRRRMVNLLTWASAIHGRQPTSEYWPFALQKIFTLYAVVLLLAPYT